MVLFEQKHADTENRVWSAEEKEDMGNGDQLFGGKGKLSFGW